MRNESGFSLLEVLVSTAVMLVVTGAIFSALNPAHGAYSQEPEVADMQQRLRVGTDTLYKDIVMAGACGFKLEMQLLSYVMMGKYCAFTVVIVHSWLMQLQHNSVKFTYTNYVSISARLRMMSSITYYLKVGAAT